MIKVIELFAGIGSQREVLKRANIEHEIVAISENDKYASRAYELPHGKTNNLGDIKNIERLPKADLWTYSFPCTDISLAGKMKGFDKGSDNLKQKELETEYDKEVKRLKDLEQEKQETNDKRNKIATFIASLKDKGTSINEFDEELFNIMVCKAIVNRDKSIEFIFNSGYKVKVEAGE